MFQGLSQGAIIPILYKDELRVVEGKVLSVNTHMPTYNMNKPMAMFSGPVTDITVQTDTGVIPFAELPANGITANFPEKGLFISTDMSAIVKEVETIASASEQALKQQSFHEKRIASCKALLMSIQPEKKKEEERAQDIESLKTQLKDMNSKFDRVMELLSAKSEEIKTV